MIINQMFQKIYKENIIMTSITRKYFIIVKYKNSLKKIL